MRRKLSTALVLGILICIGLLWIAYRVWSVREGFQFRELNVENTKEVYLYGFTGNVQSPDYTGGYTKAEAQKKCEDLGATLATREQMKELADISGHWCRVAAWTADDDAKLYYPNDSGVGICSTNDPAWYTSQYQTKIKILSRDPANGRGFAACYGVKPAVGTEPGVQDLNMNTNYYSYMDTEAIQKAMNGDGGDLMPFAFTASQALYALRQSRFNVASAREYLLNNYGGNLNTNIRAQADPDSVARDTENWTEAKGKSCEALRAVYDDIVRRLAALKAIIAAVEGRTKGMYYAKKENMNFQREIAYVCLGLTADGSPACKRLASIDFDLFYKENSDGSLGTKILGDLEALNAMLLERECEIQRGLLRTEILNTNLRCPAPSASTAELVGSFIKGGKFLPDTPNCENLLETSPWKEILADGDPRFTIKKNVGLISSEVLKKAFEEISPFFSAAGYQSIFSVILNNLSELLRIPTLNDYDSAATNLKIIPQYTDSINKIVVNTFTVR